MKFLLLFGFSLEVIVQQSLCTMICTCAYSICYTYVYGDVWTHTKSIIDKL